MNLSENSNSDETSHSSIDGNNTARPWGWLFSSVCIFWFFAIPAAIFGQTTPGFNWFCFSFVTTSFVLIIYSFILMKRIYDRNQLGVMGDMAFFIIAYPQVLINGVAEMMLMPGLLRELF